VKSGWTRVAIGDVCQIVSGATPKTSVAEYWEGGVLWATPKDLSDLGGAKFVSSTARSISDGGLRSCAATVLPPGSVLLSSRAPIGLVAINTVPMATNQGFKSLIPSEEVDASYLYWWLRTNRRSLEARGRGATFKEISRTVTAEVELPLPPLEEQKRIAAILDKADDLQARRRAAITHLDSLTQAIFQARFGELLHGSGDPVELGKLTDPDRPICYGILKPGPDLSTGRPYVRVVDIQDGQVKHGQVRRTSIEIDDQYRRSRLRQGDLVMSIRGHVGRLAIVPAELDGANITQDSARLAVTEAHPRFVLEHLRHPATQEWMRRNTKGAAVRGLNIGDLRRVPIFLPKRTEQDAFASAAESVYEGLELSRAAAADGQELASALTQKAFKGEL
jgi:type I restriction enzyme S subunit